MPDRRQDDLPVRFGPYTLVSLLGVGGMARVYRAIREGPMGFRKELAVKLIRAGDTPESRGLVKHLVNEARLGGQLRHPNVVDTYEFGAVGDEHYIAMELVNGLTLRTLLSGLAHRSSRLPLTAVLDLAMQVGQGLDYAHALGSPDGSPLNLIHRDLKPANIIVTMTGQSKIMDFGIARSEAALFRSTSADTTKGTLKYMSPEQLSEPATLDHRSDLFSLGAILYECITGQQLVQANTAEAVMWNLVSGAYVAKLDEIDDPYAALRPVLAKCLEKDRDRRFASAGALCEDLAELQLDLGDGFGCQELMALHLAHANGEDDELQRLQVKIQQRVDRIGRDSGWVTLVQQLDAQIDDVTDHLVDSILHTQGVITGGVEILDSGQASDLGEVTVVWQAEDATGAAAAGAEDEGTTRAFTDLGEGGTDGATGLTTATEQATTPPPPPSSETEATTLVHSDPQVVGLAGEVSQSTMETQLPTGMAEAAARLEARPSRRKGPWILAATAVAGIVGLLGISVVTLAIWQPWRSPIGDAATTEDTEPPAVIEEISVSDEPTIEEQPTEAPTEVSTVHEQPAPPVHVEPATAGAEPATNAPAADIDPAEGATDESPTAASAQPVRVFVNADPWATWTLTGSQTGSGDCPHIRDLLPGTYHFQLKVPDTGETHTLTVEVTGDEGEIKRCWSFAKNGPC